MRGRARSDAGFTLIEMVVSTGIMLAVTAGVFTVLNPSQGIFQQQPEVADMQQRLRVGVDTLKNDLMMAGAGSYAGSQSGSLIGFFAPVMPFVQGWSNQYDDGQGVFRTNRITLLYVPSTASQTRLQADMVNGASTIAVTREFGCPVNNQLCGFKVGTTLLIYDTTGAFDTFTVTAVGLAGQLTLQHTQQGALSKAYLAANTQVAELGQHSYFLDANTNQLMHYDGFNTATPILDNVVGLDFEYYGDPAPPVRRKPGTIDLSTTYGPAPLAPPPALNTINGWPIVGENCVIQMVGGQQVARLATLTANTTLVQLTPAQLTDGPWCPDAGNANRYDADLLRIRKIRVTLRVQTGNASLRGLATGPNALFTQGGTARGARAVPDRSIRFDVSPRNLNLGR